MIFINCLDYVNISRRFSDIAGIDENSIAECSDYITAGKKYVEDRLEKPPENEDLVLCEYCAACAANYSYVLARLSREKNLVTSAGLYTADMSDSSLKEGAKELFLNARAQIEGLFGGSFVFMGV